MRIEALELQVLPPRNAGTWLEATQIASPLSWDARYRARRADWLGLQETVVVRVWTDRGICGLGVTRGGAAVVAIIRDHFARLLWDTDPLHREMVWERLTRAAIPYGSHGLAFHAVSAIDLALWDVACQHWQAPLQVLLGGAAHHSLPAYATTNDVALTQGVPFAGYKIAVPFGPESGQAGVAGNVALVQQLRAEIGEDAELMVDAFGSWDVAYCLAMAERLKPYRISWWEDPLPPDDEAGYQALRRAAPHLRLARGNFAFAPADVWRLLQSGTVDLLQPDLTWVGGITAGLRIQHWAYVMGVPIAWHNGAMQPWALQLSATTAGQAPWAEVVITGPFAPGGAGQLWPLPDVRDGRVAVPGMVGFASGVRQPLEGATVRLTAPAS